VRCCLIKVADELPLVSFVGAGGQTGPGCEEKFLNGTKPGGVGRI
jgi:hypothetical protein